MGSDSNNLDRFLKAQEPVYTRVLEELRSGCKRSHWMWYIFPQIAGLGYSPTARFYAISSLDEAVDYLDHPVLGARLKECTELVYAVEGLAIRQILGSPDDLKFRSSMTLFALATEDNHLFLDALRKYCKGIPDRTTLDILGMAKKTSIFPSV
jgi:uncharacterized protein (DUF1810 family)